MKNDVVIRPLTPDEAAIYRDIRLEALRVNPESFGAAQNEEAKHPLAWFAERLTKNYVLGAFLGDALVGVAGFYVQNGMKQAHKGSLWGVYVVESARRQGIARRLIENILGYAATRVEMVQLTVNSSQLSACLLYTKMGFTEYGVEKNALKHNGQYTDEIHMVKFLEPAEKGK